jgi:putative membrane protein
MRDLTLAILHHFLIFALFGLLLMEMVLVKADADAAAIARAGRIDRIYGAVAGLVILVGFGRAAFAAKGWAYYSHNGFFWAKVATFALIGLISVGPTLAFLKARKQAPTAPEIAKVRKALHLQARLFPLLLIFAAAMARGYGSF